MDVLLGMTKLLQDHSLQAVILELNTSSMRYGHDDLKIHQFMLNQGFTPVAYDPFSRALTKIDTYGSHNTIYVRSMDLVLTRVRSACPFKVFGASI